MLSHLAELYTGASDAHRVLHPHAAAADQRVLLWQEVLGLRAQLQQQRLLEEEQASGRQARP